jgi:hypothetical protein
LGRGFSHGESAADETLPLWRVPSRHARGACGAVRVGTFPIERCLGRFPVAVKPPDFYAKGFQVLNSVDLPRWKPPIYDGWLGSCLCILNEAIEKNFRNPYTGRWSFGFQRQLSSKLVLDGSYVGSESHRLTTWADVNPRQPNGQRLHPDFGGREIRTSQGNSSYHAMQWRVERRFARGFQVNASYTWSKNLDSASEGVGSPSASSRRLVITVHR